MSWFSISSFSFDIPHPTRYLFEPNRLNRMVALQVLLKALVNMPRPDFILLKSVLPPDIVSLSLSLSISAVYVHSISAVYVHSISAVYVHSISAVYVHSISAVYVHSISVVYV